MKVIHICDDVRIVNHLLFSTLFYSHFIRECGSGEMENASSLFNKTLLEYVGQANATKADATQLE